MMQITVNENGEMFDVRIDGLLHGRWTKNWIADLDEKYTEHTIQYLRGPLSRTQAEATLKAMQDWFKPENCSSTLGNYRVVV